MCKNKSSAAFSSHLSDGLYFTHTADQTKNKNTHYLSCLDLSLCGSQSVTQEQHHLPHPPSISRPDVHARTPSLQVHSHIAVSPEPAVNSQYTLMLSAPRSALTCLS